MKDKGAVALLTGLVVYLTTHFSPILEPLLLGMAILGLILLIIRP